MQHAGIVASFVECLHRQMQHDFLAGSSGDSGKAGGMGRMGRKAQVTAPGSSTMRRSISGRLPRSSMMMAMTGAAANAGAAKAHSAHSESNARAMLRPALRATCSKNDDSDGDAVRNAAA